jgi:hypothetical protein
MIEWDNPKLTIKEQARLLSVNRTGLYRQNKEPSELEIKIKHLIDKIHTDKPFKGSVFSCRGPHLLKIGHKKSTSIEMPLWILIFNQQFLCLTIAILYYVHHTLFLLLQPSFLLQLLYKIQDSYPLEELSNPYCAMVRLGRVYAARAIHPGL